MTFCLFGIQCACLQVLAVVCICTIFYALCNRVCVGCSIGTTAKISHICYNQGSIVLRVCTVYFLLSSHKVLIDFLHVLYYAVIVWFLLGQLESLIRFKFVTLSVVDC